MYCKNPIGILNKSADPIAGTEASVTLADDGRVIAIIVELVTDATVANRRVSLEIVVDTTIIFTAISPAVQTASSTVEYVFGVDMPFTDATTQQFIPLPNCLILPRNAILRTSTASIAVGDDYGVMVVSGNQ